MAENIENNQEQLDENHLIAIRKEKLKELQSQGKDPFKVTKYNRTHLSQEIKDNYEELEGKDVSVAGRIMAKRIMGKASFCTIQDAKGKIQSYVSINDLGEESYSAFKTYDIGDIIGIKGFVFKTRTEEISVHAKEVVLLTKSLRPLPEKFHGLQDPELCYRNRYVDMIMNEETRNRFLIRFKFIRELRNYLDNLGYYEIETPILNNKPSGAVARPFVSHHNALDLDVYLRIAPETYMKRAIIAGIPKVYEIARCFRNEGMDATHLQDFTMIECYQAYYNYEDNMKLIRTMV